MKFLRITFTCCGFLAGSMAPRVAAQTLPPATIQYQGRVSVAGAAHNGTGYFKFLLFAPDKRLWSNDDSHGGAEPLDGYEPAGSVSVSVSAGLFSADLGSGAMPAITPGVFFDGTGNVRSEVSLRVWFSATGGGTFVKLSPDRRLSSVPFALVAGTVARAAITNDKLASEAVTADKIKNGEVVAGKLGPGAVAAGNLAPGAAVANLQNGSLAESLLAGAMNGAGTETTPGAVTSEKIKDGTIQSRDVAVDGIAPDRLQRDIAVLADVKPGTSNGGDAAAGWQLRTLNTTEASSAGAQSAISLSGSTITVQPGTYFVRGSFSAFGVDRHQAVLRDVTGSPASPVIALRGTSDNSLSTTEQDYANSRSVIEGMVAVTGQARSYQVWHYCARGQGDYGMGLSAFTGASTFLEANIFSRITIERLR